MSATNPAFSLLLSETACNHDPRHLQAGDECGHPSRGHGGSVQAGRVLLATPTKRGAHAHKPGLATCHTFLRHGDRHRLHASLMFDAPSLIK